MKGLTFLIVLMSAAGCASGAGLVTTGRIPVTTEVSTAAGTFSMNSVSETRISSHWVRASSDSVWAVLPAIYEELGIEAGVIGAPEMQYGNREIRARRSLAGERPSMYLNCGMNPIGTPLADGSAIRFDLITVVDPQGVGTELLTLLEAVARPLASGGGEVNCRSTGKLEARIIEMVNARLPS